MNKEIFSYADALKASLEYFKGNELAATTFLNKYALKDDKDNLLEKTPADMHRRLAREFARVEAKKFKKPMTEEEIFGWFDKFQKIIPQGSPMAGIGNPYQTVSLSNCFVAESPEDSYGSIFRTDQQLAQICKRRGGVGACLDNLRPAGSPTSNAAKTSTGTPSFAERFSNTIREVGQNNRRGALMVMLSCIHPDIAEWANMKRDRNKVTGANVSIKLTDRFMEAVTAGGPFLLQWPVDVTAPTYSKSVEAKLLWDIFIANAHENAEPGLLFWDRILSESPGACYAKHGFKEVATNPCAELPLPAFDACRLLLLNLWGFIRGAFTETAKFDWNAFTEAVKVAQRLMDDLVDLEVECIDRIIRKIKAKTEEEEISAEELRVWTLVRKKCVQGRRTGTGITALGDVVAAMGLRYGSDESIKFVEKLYKTMKLAAYWSSVEMAKELGAFPIWDHELEKDCPFLVRIKEEDEALWNEMKKHGRRNIALLTTAPAGSVSILAETPVGPGTSSGIEPVFKMSYTRKRKVTEGSNSRVDSVDAKGDKWEHFTVYHAGVKAWMDATGLNDIRRSPYNHACANDIDWQARVKLQAAAQRHVDHSISSTINLPTDISKEEVAKIYMAAWEAGCKGITVYREGSRDGVLVDSAKLKADNYEKRPESLPCSINHCKVKGQEYFVVIGINGGGLPYEVFAGKNGFIPKEIKEGTVTKLARGAYQLKDQEGKVMAESLTKHCEADEEGLTRLVSVSLRHKVPLQYVVHQLEKTKGEMFILSKAIARSLKKFVENGVHVTGETCAVCSSGDSLRRQEGCVTCMACGWTKCS